MPGDKADDRDDARGVGRLDELGDLLRLAGDERGIADLAGEPQHELVQEEDDAVVAEGLRVRADRREPLVERDERVGRTGDRVDVARHERLHHVADQPLGLRGVGRGGERLLDVLFGPGALDFTPLALCPWQAGSERVGPHPLADLARIVDQTLGAVYRRQRRRGMLPPDVGDVPAEDRGFEALRPDEVVGHEQEALLPQPVMPGQRVGQFGPRARVDVTAQQRMQDGHEVALA